VKRRASSVPSVLPLRVVCCELAHLVLINPVSPDFRRTFAFFNSCPFLFCFVLSNKVQYSSGNVHEAIKIKSSYQMVSRGHQDQEQLSDGFAVHAGDVLKQRWLRLEPHRRAQGGMFGIEPAAVLSLAVDEETGSRRGDGGHGRGNGQAALCTVEQKSITYGPRCKPPNNLWSEMQAAY
jgi:hypothetical protein